MAAQKPSDQINLLPQEEFASTTSGRILHWLLSTFRYLVIFTELIVIVAFLSRFYFDSRAADLNDEINQKKEFIEAYAPFESQFRETQKRLAVYSQMTDEQNKVSPFVEKIVESLPKGVSLNTLNINTGDTILIEGVSVDEKDISQFVVNLREYDRFHTVELTQVETTTADEQVTFTIQIGLGTT